MQLTWKRIKCHTRYAWKIARAGSSAEGNGVERTIVSFSHAGVTGQGEAAPTPYYNQSLDTVEATCAQVTEELEQFASAFDAWAEDIRTGATLDRDPDALNALVDLMITKFPDQRAAISAIDLAIHDWWGKVAQKPLWQILGIDRDATPLSSMSIGIDDLSLLPEKVKGAAAFKILKMKVGTEGDVATLTKLREIEPSKVLRVDANCGWTPENVIERVRQLEAFKLEFIEQPLPKNLYDHVKRLRSATDLPIVADEDSVDPGDVLRLDGIYDGINIKLSKCGGIREARRMISMARELGMKIMLGCMVETSLGISAGAQLSPLVDYVDLDGHLLLADDPYAGLVVQDGKVLVSDQSGLGVSLK